jgi:hypothetical protein
MATDVRQRAKDLMNLALDKRNNSKAERLNAACKALQYIADHKLLDDPLDGLIDSETRDLIESVEKTARGVSRLFSKVRSTRRK